MDHMALDEYFNQDRPQHPTSWIDKRKIILDMGRDELNKPIRVSLPRVSIQMDAKT